MKILFMGTPDFAAVALAAICDAGEDVIGVITLPDRPVGRGYKLTPSAVKVCALERNIPVYQPTTLKGDEFAALLDEIAPIKRRIFIPLRLKEPPEIRHKADRTDNYTAVRLRGKNAPINIICVRSIISIGILVPARIISEKLTVLVMPPVFLWIRLR